jgi:hypothetical protein
MCGRGQASGSFHIQNTCTTIFFLFFQSIRRHSIAAKHCSRIVLQVFAAPDTPSDHNNRIAERFSSLVQTESRVAMTNCEAAVMELTFNSMV